MVSKIILRFKGELMLCKFIKVKGLWSDVLDSARVTINKESINKDPSSWWKKRILLAEHSPIRQIIIKSKWENLKSWVSAHFVRHWLGIVHWVRSQRTDRTGVNRDELKQSELIEHEIEANAQSIINISRKRLCSCASQETREAWNAFLESFKDVEPELHSVCVPECIYRGFCPEFNCCGYFETEKYEENLKNYREVLKND
jgi:hypothetical protein